MGRKEATSKKSFHYVTEEGFQCFKVKAKIKDGKIVDLDLIPVKPPRKKENTKNAGKNV